MNVFFTNLNPVSAALEHCYKHQTKMIVEYTQLLSTAHRFLDGQLTKVWVKRVTKVKLEDGTSFKRVRCKEVNWYELPSDSFEVRFNRRWLTDKQVYAATHINHPSAKWVRDSKSHYDWVHACANELCRLYTARTGKVHATEAILDAIHMAPVNIDTIDLREPPVAAPDEFKAIAVFDGAVEAYRQYMVSKFNEWTQRAKPIKVEFDKKPVWFV